MKKRIIICTISILVAGMQVYGQEKTGLTQKLNLKECISVALKNNLDVQRSTLQATAADINFQQSKASLLPSLNASIMHGVNQGRSIDPSTNAYINQQNEYGSQDLIGSLLLFNGLAQQNIIREASLLFKASKQREQQLKESLTLNIIFNYLQVLTNEDLLELAYKQQQITLIQLERLEVLNKQGAIAPNDYYDLKGQYTNDQLAVVNTKNALENAKVALAQQMNVPYDAALRLEPLVEEAYALIYEASPEQVYQSALQNLAAVKAADFTEKSARMRIKYIQGGYYPSIYLRGGMSSNFSSASLNAQKQAVGYFDQFDNNLNRTVNLSIVIPLFNFIRTKNAVSLARIYHNETILLAQNARTQLQQVTAQAYFNMTAAKDRYVTLNNQVDAFTESFRATDARFSTGVINSVDYLISKNNLDKAKTYFVTARYDFILRKKVLDFYQGKLAL